MGITEHLVAYITQSIAAGGYPVVGVLMMLESMVFPVPSEAVMPFAGFLVNNGTFSFWTVVIVSTIGSLIGSLLSYAIGRYGGRIFLEKWGKYFLLNQQHLDVTDTFFQRRGAAAIFIARFIPVVRHLVSIPAGITKMNVTTFSLYTVLGAGLWNTFLLYAGIVLGQNWTKLGQYMHYLDIVVVGVVVLGIGYFVSLQFKQN
jgi:membrane protein DedA with SNARE-associated domain